MFDPIDFGWFLWLGINYCALAVGGVSMLFVDWQNWYAPLRKAPWNPPDWVFGIVWPVLATLAGVAGQLVWRAPESAPSSDIYYAGVSLLLLRIVLMAAWTPIFFGARMLTLGLFVLLLNLATTVSACALSWLIYPVSGGLLVPECAWLTLAATLNLYVLAANDFDDDETASSSDRTARRHDGAVALSEIGVIGSH